MRKCIHCGEPIMLTTWGGWMHKLPREGFGKTCRRDGVTDMVAEPEADR